jgi:succinoglycan biosynthesis transport protein ExoP
MSSEGGDPQGVTLREYARVLWGRKRVVIGVTVLLVGLALAYSFVKTPMYQATATLIYQTPLDVSDPLSSSSVDAAQRQVELKSVASVITSPDLVSSAREKLTADDIALRYSVTSEPEVSVGESDSSTVLITGVSRSAATAARVANAYASAFTELRKTEEQEQVRQAEQVVQRQLDSFRTVESRQSAEYFTLLQRLQDLQILEATVTGNFRVLVPATPPAAPFSPNLLLNCAMALAAGLVLGVGLALLLDQFDTRVRTQEEAAEITGMPVIGAIRKLSGKALGGDPLTVLTDSRSPAAEAIRKLRSNLEFADVDGDLKSLVITSALQHEGKSLAICSLALSMAAAGRRVVLVDGDLRRPQVHRYLDLPSREGISTVLTGRSNLRQALQSRTVGPSLTTRDRSGETSTLMGSEPLHVLTSGPVPPNPAEVIASNSFAAIIAELEQEFDLVIVDAPSVLAVGDTAAIARCVNGLVLLADLTMVKRPSLKEASRQIAQMPCRKLGLVVVSDGHIHRYAHHYEYYAEFESPLDTAVGEDSRSDALRTRKPKGSERARIVTEEVDGQPSDAEDPLEALSGGSPGSLHGTG